MTDIVSRDTVLSNLGDRWWRLNNLYKIRDKKGRVVVFRPNAAQVDLFQNYHNKNVILKARQWG